MRMKGVMAAAVLTLAGLVLSGCGGVAVGPSDPPANPPQTTAPAAAPAAVQSGPFVVAVLAPLSGDVAPIGQELVNAASVAVFEKPEADVKLVPFDTKGTPEGAAQAAAEARAANPQLVLGPLFRDHVAIARDAFAGVPVTMLAFTNDTEQAGGDTFVLGLSVSAQVERLAGFLAGEDRRRLIVIGPESPTAERAIQAAAATAPAMGGELVRSAMFDPEADFNQIAETVREITDYDGRRAVWAAYEQQLKPRVRSAPNPAAFLDAEAARFGVESVRGRMLTGMAQVYRTFAGSGRNRALAETIQRIEGVDAMPVTDYDAILLPFADENLVAIGSMLDLYNAGRGFAQLVGTEDWATIDLAAEPSLIGGWFVKPSEVAAGPFTVNYRNHFQDEPDRIAVVGYHAARVAVEAALAQMRPVTSSFVRRPDGFDGLAGTVRFGGDNILRHPLSIYQVNPEGPQELQGPLEPGTS